VRRSKLLNLGVLLTSLIGYLEWGQDQSMFLFQAEADLIVKGLTSPGEVLHPFTLLPLLGQLALVATLFQQTPGKRLTYAGIAGIGLLLAFMCLIGLMSFNVKIFASTIPFLVLAVLTVRHHRSAG